MAIPLDLLGSVEECPIRQPILSIKTSDISSQCTVGTIFNSDEIRTPHGVNNGRRMSRFGTEPGHSSPSAGDPIDQKDSVSGPIQ